MNIIDNINDKYVHKNKCQHFTHNKNKWVHIIERQK